MLGQQRSVHGFGDQGSDAACVCCCSKRGSCHWREERGEELCVPCGLTGYIFMWTHKIACPLTRRFKKKNASIPMRSVHPCTQAGGLVSDVRARAGRKVHARGAAPAYVAATATLTSAGAAMARSESRGRATCAPLRPVLTRISKKQCVPCGLTV